MKVIMEHKCGWIEVIDGVETRKGRVGDYIVVSNEYKVGDEFLIGVEEASDNIVSTEPSSQSAAEIIPSQTVPSITTGESKFTLGSLFYWKCHECLHDTIFLDKSCNNCSLDRSEKSSPSALLQVAEIAIKTAQSFDEARNNIPALHRGSIPNNVLLACLRGKTSFVERFFFNNPQAVAKYYYWNCCFCTMQNSYKVHTCKGCTQKVRHYQFNFETSFLMSLISHYLQKNELAESSILLQLASEAATTSITVEEAMNKIPPLHSSAIPIGVMSTLVTCIATISKNKNRRCLRAKMPGSNYCTIHKNPFPSKNECVIVPTSKSPSPSKRKRTRVFKSVAQIKKDVQKFFSEISPTVYNGLKWNIQSIEDAFLAERNNPFALGLHVRRYFPGYGKYYVGQCLAEK